jgi:hypothetical protein
VSHGVRRTFQLHVASFDPVIGMTADIVASGGSAGGRGLPTAGVVRFISTHLHLISMQLDPPCL